MADPSIRIIDCEQRSAEWYAARRGIVTASTVGQLISVGPPDALTVDCPTCSAIGGEPCISTARKVPTPIKVPHGPRTSAAADMPPVYRPSTSDTAKAITLLLVSERITGRTEPTFESADMLRGRLDEPLARDVYRDHYAEVTECGFMVRSDWGFEIGYSPDGLVGDDGLIEVKSRRPRMHLQTILADEVPPENLAQCQCGLLVAGRRWIDYVSYCGGLPLWTKRVYPDPAWQGAIVGAVRAFETTAAEMVATYRERTAGLPETVRVDHFAEIEV